MNPIRQSKALLESLTDNSQERNIYIHPNPIARDIFWQRLEILSKGLKEHTSGTERVIDFGGGSGAYLRGLCSIFTHVDVVDLDPQDARNLAEHHQIKNCTIHETNVSTWAPETPTDLVIATDVLEHFQDLAFPIERIKAYLKPEGLLAISVPTENWIYLLGRKIVNKTKPKDHYHAGEDILARLEEEGFQVIWKTFAPQYLNVEVPLFRLAILKKK